VAFLLLSAKDTQDGDRQTPIQVLQEKSQNMYIGREEELVKVLELFQGRGLAVHRSNPIQQQRLLLCTRSTEATRGTIAG
jgi:hypothetical protein